TLLPLFAYYGGTLFTVTGALAIALGGAVRAYVLWWLVGFAAAYGGWYWLSRIAGVGRWLAHVPGFVFITSGYYLTLIYARGDFAEFSAISQIPLIVAAGLSVLLSDRVRLWPALALAISTLLFVGSHNISLLWGLTLLAVIALLLVIIVPDARRVITFAGMLRVAALTVPAALVNAWFLAPAVAYGGRTWVSTGLGLGLAHTLYATKPLVSAGHLFSAGRPGASLEAQDFVLAFPLLAIIWVLVGIALTVARRRFSPWVRVQILLAAIGALLVVTMTHPSVILDLPRPYQLVQFTYRLDTYVVMVLCGAILATVVLLRQRADRWARAWMWALAVVLAGSAAGAISQVNTHPTVIRNRDAAFSDTSRAVGLHLLDQQLTYSDVTLPTVPTSLPLLSFPAASVKRNRLIVAAPAAPTPRLFRTNLAGAPYFVSVTGATIVGRDRARFMVLRVPPRPAGTTGRITVASADHAPAQAGRIVTGLALAFWLGLVIWSLITRRSRSARHAGADATR
ncbi:MAG: hypothetical protein M3016_04865, partial [Actinomycetota bacterium]|nr:hypothetical protein [Actinomycetota bacterium]